MRLIYYWLIYTRPSYVTTLASTWWFVIDLFLPWPFLWFHSGVLLFFPDHRVCWPVREISTETRRACGASVWPDHCWQLPVLDWLAGKHAVIKGNMIDREFFSLIDWLMNWLIDGFIHSFIHSIAYSLTHSFTYQFIYVFFIAFMFLFHCGGEGRGYYWRR